MATCRKSKCIQRVDHKLPSPSNDTLLGWSSVRVMDIAQSGTLRTVPLDLSRQGVRKARGPGVCRRLKSADGIARIIPACVLSIGALSSVLVPFEKLYRACRYREPKTNVKEGALLTLIQDSGLSLSVVETSEKCVFPSFCRTPIRALAV